MWKTDDPARSQAILIPVRGVSTIKSRDIREREASLLAQHLPLIAGDALRPHVGEFLVF
jgi:hypothetical protein